ncbi:hypothetical protein GCM10027435_08410 [Haloparvum alkalitolerans]|uniref:hypothetical protein n=1 Tax=Haloparvum alkalitolerans TaxID=1042953 RepID=UPI003CEBB886
MTHELEFAERARQAVAGLLHAPLSLVGLYAERATPRDQYACTLAMPHEEVEALLHRLGFVRNLLSSLKYRAYATDPEVTEASWAWYPEGALWSDHQLHLALYVGPDRDTTDVYAHWEPSWIRHPIRHYRAESVDAAEGIRRFRTLLRENEVPFDVRGVDERYGPDAAAGTRE